MKVEIIDVIRVSLTEMSHKQALAFDKATLSLRIGYSEASYGSTSSYEASFLAKDRVAVETIISSL